MSVSGVESTTATTTATAAAVGANTTLGKTEFLSLLIAQLQNQDPLNPADSTEFTAQLAQFSSLEQMTNMNETLERMESALGGNTNTQAVSYIGKAVLAEGDSLRIGSDGLVDPALVRLDGDAASVFVNIYDASGDLVRRLETDALEAGDHAISWDGNDSSGNPLAAGLYSYEIQAVDEDDEPVDTRTYVSGMVSSVGYEDAGAYLNINGRQVSLGNVIQVMDAVDE